MAVRKEFRDLTVGDIYRNGKSVPMLRVEKQYKSPLWALKHVVNKGNEFNKVIDELFKLANATGDSITQEDVSKLLEGLKKSQVLRQDGLMQMCGKQSQSMVVSLSTASA